MSILGNRVVRREDPKFLTVGGTYVDDVELSDALWVAYVRSSMPHARIERLDTEAARRSPGVVAVLTAEDLSSVPVAAGMAPEHMGRPPLAEGTVRFVGEPVAAVVAESRAEATDAADLVEIDYEPLPAVVTVEDALKGETVVFPDAGSNVAAEVPSANDQTLFDGCEVVVAQRIVNQRVAPCPLEVRAAAARPEGEDRLTFWATTQAPFGVRDSVAAVTGLAPDQVRVIAPDVGGGFGAKMGAYPEELLVAVVARRFQRSARWCESRSESMVGLGHGRAQVQQITIGGSRDGTVKAYRLEVVQDAGGYPSIGMFLPYMTMAMLTGTYAIERAEFTSRSVVTNTTPIGAYRGAGRPEATAALERAMDLFADEIGMDPAEVRRRNVIASDAFPYSTPTGTVYDTGDYAGALDLALQTAGYEELRSEQRRRREAGDPVQLGIGLALYVEITNGVPGGEFASVEVRPDGKAVVMAGTSPQGQGHETAWSMLVAEALGISMDDVEVVHSDTDVVPRGRGAMGSRSLQTGGVAARQAAHQVVEQARDLAADLLEAAPEDLVVDPEGGGLQVAGTPSAARTWAELARVAEEKGEQLRAEVDFTPDGPTFPFGAHVAVVELDTETGGATLRRLVAVDDAGRILNPLLADGQVHGGLAQGAAQALLEEVAYDEGGNPLTTNLADYAFISAAELPSFETVRMETPTPLNELGAKGIGESGTIGSTPAVQNAVIDALRHLGVRHIDMPVTPERVWKALKDAAEVRA